MKCQDFDISQFVTSKEDMMMLIDSPNHLVLKAFGDNWSKKSRALDAVEEIEFKVRNPKDFEVQNIFINTSDITKEGIKQEMIKNKKESGDYYEKF